MKKWILAFCIVMFMAANASLAIGGDYGLDGPAPNSGDGVSDGSGFDGDPTSPGDGPAPNSGDGVSDGSGFRTFGAKTANPFLVYDHGR